MAEPSVRTTPEPAVSSEAPDFGLGEQKNRVWLQFKKHRVAMASMLVLTLIALSCVFAPLLARHAPTKVGAGRPFAAPSATHWLGTDSLGRDIFSRLLHGGRVSLSVGLVSVGIYLVIGTALGAVSGYFGGWTDMAIQRITETVMTMPTLLIIITIVTLVGNSIYNIFLAIGLLGWTGVCRIVRSQFLSLREREFVVSARAIGVGNTMIVFRHILPNTIAPIIVSGTLGVAGAILTETGLSFLGLGVQPPTPSWGNMLLDATRISTLEGRPWLWVPPGLAISFTVLCINFIGDGLRDALDPRQRT